MEQFILLNVLEIPTDDWVAITFFIGYMAMFASAVFFFVERGNVSQKWKTSLLVSGLITGIAAVHYYYMKDYYLATGENPTALRYIDWTLTVPLMCVEFYLLTKPFGAKGSTLFKLILASIGMLITGFIGETTGVDSNIFWGVLSTIFYLYIVYEVFAGDVAKLTQNSNSEGLKQAMFLMKIFITAGWAIYPIGYMILPGNLLSGVFETSQIDLFYNIADAVNKIGFGLVVYYVATKETAKEKAAA
ncbi:MAG: bacteriorhodopsin [Cyclobacteriaceae bacterium]|nr:bacteriorhodopsin [Cyclobacteriaceae bacterium]MCH8517596.1 bacteriorhodopsin [Cyclobacteriaceae bacterium]